MKLIAYQGGQGRASARQITELSELKDRRQQDNQCRANAKGRAHAAMRREHHAGPLSNRSTPTTLVTEGRQQGTRFEWIEFDNSQRDSVGSALWLGRLLIRRITKRLSPGETPFFLHPDIMHQSCEATAGDGLTITLGNALRSKARSNLGPRRAVFTVHPFQFPKVLSNNFSRARFDLADRRILPLGFQQFHVIAKAFEIDIHGHGNSVGFLKRHFINR
jgi:hypothetical protein